MKENNIIPKYIQEIKYMNEEEEMKYLIKTKE